MHTSDKQSVWPPEYQELRPGRRPIGLARPNHDIAHGGSVVAVRSQRESCHALCFHKLWGLIFDNGGLVFESIPFTSSLPSGPLIFDSHVVSA